MPLKSTGWFCGGCHVLQPPENFVAATAAAADGSGDPSPSSTATVRVPKVDLRGGKQKQALDYFSVRFLSFLCTRMYMYVYRGFIYCTFSFVFLPLPVTYGSNFCLILLWWWGRGAKVENSPFFEKMECWTFISAVNGTKLETFCLECGGVGGVF